MTPFTTPVITNDTLPPAANSGALTASDALGRGALDYAARGWHVFPLHTPTAHGCTCERTDCKRAGKHPRTRNGSTDASRDPATIRAWWNRWPDANIGIATGPESGLLVLDVDPDKGGEESVVKWAKRGWNLPDTWSVRTGGGGAHHYFVWPEGEPVRNSASKIAPGIDIRGVGGHVVAPPSLHATGARYETTSGIPPAPCPPWLLELTAHKDATSTSAAASEIGILFEGNRNDGLMRLAGALRRRGATLDQLREKLLLANGKRCRPPLPESEVFAIARSAARYEPHGPDPLECAWRQVALGDPLHGYQKFLALAQHLQDARPEGLPIALPLKRIAGLFQRDWTQVRRWRRRAVQEGLLVPQERYVPHRRAGLYSFSSCPTRSVPLGQNVPLNKPTSGLVGQRVLHPSSTVLDSQKHTQSPAGAEIFNSPAPRNRVCQAAHQKFIEGEL